MYTRSELRATAFAQIPHMSEGIVFTVSTCRSGAVRRPEVPALGTGIPTHIIYWLPMLERQIRKLRRIQRGERKMIVKRGTGYHVVSEDGKKSLGGPYKTRAEAEKRLRQVEYFKKKKD
jgi:hypothetical protein